MILMASCLQDTEDRSNGTKLSRLLIDGGTEAQRRVFDRFQPPSSLGAALQDHLPLLTHLRCKKILNSNQWDTLFPCSGAAPDSKQFDITLLYTLLRNICGLTPPATGWNSLPAATDTTLEANLARIKYYRNEVYGHISTTAVGKEEFEHYWKEISCTLVALGLDQSSIDDLKSSPLGRTDYLLLLGDLKEISEETKREMHKTRETAEKTKTEVDKARVAAEKARDIAELVKTETEKTGRALEQNASKINRLVEQVSELQKTSPMKGKDIVRDSAMLSQLYKSDFTGHINYLAKYHHPCTRTWILDEIQQHLDSEESQCVIITAQPGLGKSVIAAVLCKSLEEKGRLAACHFIQHDNSLRNNPRFIMESLAVSLCASIPGARLKLEESLSRNSGKELNNMNCNELCTFLLEHPLNSVEEPPQSVAVVVDALDECDPNQKDELVRALLNVIPKLPKWLKFVMTTRPIQGVIPKVSILTVINIEAENRNNTTDIELYLTCELRTLYKDSTLQQIKEAVARLVEKSNGIFLVVHFVIDCIRDQETELFQIHKLFPKGISSVYEEYFKCLVTGLDVEEKTFFDFLEAVVAAKQPLPESIVLQILGLSGDSRDVRKTARQTLKNMSNLFPSHDGHIAMFHKSVSDWLTRDHSNEEHHYFSVSIKDGHRVLAEHCLDYLRNIKTHKSFPPPVNDCERYALRFGFHHMLEAGDYEEQLRECVHDLELISAQYSTSKDEWYGMRNVRDQLQAVCNAFNWPSEDLHDFVTNLKHLNFERGQFYPQAVLQAAMYCPFTSDLRKQAEQLLQTPKYNFAYVAPTQKEWDLPEDLRFVVDFQVSENAKVAACVGSMKSGNFFVATFDVATGKCTAVAEEAGHEAPLGASPIQPKRCVTSIVQGEWEPVGCAVSPDGKYVAVVTFDSIEVRFASSLQVKKTFTTDSRPAVSCFLPCGRKLVAGYCDSKVRVWSMGIGKKAPRYVLDGHSQHVMLCTISPSGIVLTRDQCGTAIVWHSFNPARPISIVNRESACRSPYSVTMSPDGSRIAVLCNSKPDTFDTEVALVISLFSSADGKLLQSFPIGNKAPRMYLFIDNIRLAVGKAVEGYVLNTDTGETQSLLFLPVRGGRRYTSFKRLGGQEYLSRVDNKILLNFNLCNVK